MKKFVLFLKILVFSEFLNAQDFSTKLYFTDNIDRKDTLTIGKDINATYDIDSIFGESNLAFPAGDEFKVFFIDNRWIYESEKESKFYLKKQIVPATNGWIENGAISIAIPINSLPVTIKWDRSKFINNTVDHSIITDWSLGGWFDSGTMSFKEFLKDTSSIVVTNNQSGIIYYAGVERKEMLLIYIALGDSKNILASASSLKINPQIELRFVQNKIILINNSLEKILGITIFSLNGKIIAEVNSEQVLFNDIYLNLIKGFYIAKVKTKKQNYFYTILKAK